MTEKTLEFWFDFSCPYAYLASTQVEALAERAGAKLVPKPVLLGGIFKAVGTNQNLFATLGAAKTAHSARDLQRYAQLWEVPLEMPGNHPMRTVTALRAVLAAGEPYMPLTHAFYRAYWVEHRDISSSEVISEIIEEAGYDSVALMKRVGEQSIKDDLRNRTDEAIELGFFGLPGFRVKDEIYWGQDRMHFVENALGGSAPTVARIAHRPSQEIYPVDFYFDYSSPFSYLAAMRVPHFLGPHARWKPMLLGAVFKSVGMANVPLFEASPAKQRYLQLDCKRQAEEAEAAFTWPSNFPMNTVLPLRMTLIVQKDRPDLAAQFIHETYVAFWGRDENISDPEVMIALAERMGLDGRYLVEGTQNQEIKNALRHSTEEAVSSGVFGAPSFVVRNTPGGGSVYWGNDRLPMVTRSAQGDTRVV